MRRLLMVLFAGSLAGALFGPLPAAAHGGLVGSSPPQGSASAQPVDAVSLTFTEKPAPYAYFTVTAPGGARVDDGWSHAQPMPLATPAREFQEVNGVWQPMEYRTGFPVRIKVAHWPAAGTYVVRYHTVASDGDLVKGEMSFSYTGAPTAAPAGWQPPSDRPKPELLAAAETEAAPAPAAQHWYDDMWAWFVPVLLLVAAGLAYLLLRPGRQPAGGPVRERQSKVG
ncbi:copper resistance CopC family protein [Symbioplanes lichenis]|uniref:copper resistance CopC family protein n=1 Tax=Symbioplanes lichenis TaxID=1629072 RepID=UPI0027391F8C|nr:copper resistance CopC family protein [Actinoplanes lichenis]